MRVPSFSPDLRRAAGTAFPPLLITFEGIDGSGKSTQAALLVERMRETGADPVAVREPGGTELSERVREILLDPRARIAPRAELLLFAAARAQLCEEVIRAALADGRPVICDRFFDSTTAYQGAGRHLADMEWLNQFHRFTTGGLIPDRTYIIDVPPEVAAARRAREGDRMEMAGDPFFERVRTAYKQLAALEPERVNLIDGLATPDEIHRSIWEDLRRLPTGTGSGPSGYPAAPADE
jgi:dTMP kinase